MSSEATPIAALPDGLRRHVRDRLVPLEFRAADRAMRVCGDTGYEGAAQIRQPVIARAMLRGAQA